MMRKITYLLTLALIFTIPWEDTFRFEVGTGSSFTKLFGLGVAGFWFLTVVMEGRIFKPTLFHGLVAIFFIWNIISFWWTPQVAYQWSYERVQTYAQIFILMIIVWAMMETPGELLGGLQAYILGAFVPIVSALNNYMHGTMAENYEVRFSATGVNAVDMALFLLLGLPMAWHLFNHSRNRILKLVNLAYLPLSVFTVLLTASRTSLFAIVPAVIYIAWPKKLDAGRIALTAVLGVVSLILLQALLPASVIERLSSVATSISNADIGGRVSLWLASVGVFTQHPIFGSGAASLSALIGSLAHQTFLSVLAETGLIGFFMFAAILLYIFLEIRKLPKGYIGLWMSTFFVWMIGVLSLSFEFRKITWLFFSFMVLQGYVLRKQWQSQKEELRLSEAEEVSPAAAGAEPIGLQSLSGEDTWLS